MASKVAEAYLELRARNLMSADIASAGMLAKSSMAQIVTATVEAGRAVADIFRQLTSMTRGYIDAAVGQEDAHVRLAGVIRATGGAAGFTVGQLEDMADQLQQTTRFGREETESAMALMATFRQVRGPNFEAAIRAAADLSSVMHQSLYASTMQLGRALGDPERGVGALRRAGVQLSEQQKQQIHDFMAVNDVASAQRIVLQELQHEVGGMANAMGATAGGQIARFGNTLRDLAASVGHALVPAMRVILPVVEQMTRGISTVLIGIATRVVPLLESGFRALEDFMESNRSTFDEWGTTLRMIADSTIPLLIQAWQAFTQDLSESFRGITGTTGPSWETIKRIITTTLDEIAITVRDLPTTWQLAVTQIALWWSQGMDWLADAGKGIVAPFAGGVSAITFLFSRLWNNLKADSENAVIYMGALFQAMWAGFKAFWASEDPGQAFQDALDKGYNNAIRRAGPAMKTTGQEVARAYQEGFDSFVESHGGAGESAMTKELRRQIDLLHKHRDEVRATFAQEREMREWAAKAGPYVTGALGLLGRYATHTLAGGGAGAPPEDETTEKARRIAFTGFADYGKHIQEALSGTNTVALQKNQLEQQRATRQAAEQTNQKLDQLKDTVKGLGGAYGLA